MNLFVDNNLSPLIARTLAVFLESEDGMAVHPRDKNDLDIEHDTKDVVWMKKLQTHKRDWCVLSGDVKIMRNLGEKKAWQESGLTGFFVRKSFKQKPLELQLAQLFRLFREMEKLAEKTFRAGIAAQFYLPPSGVKIEKIKKK